MYNALHPHFAKAHVIITSEVLASEREERQTKSGASITFVVLTVRFTYWAEDGSSISSIMIGEAMDMSDKATNKAMSNALKYALMQTFLIPTDDLEKMEMDRPSVEVKAKTQQTITLKDIAVTEEVLAQVNLLEKAEDIQTFYKKHPQYHESKQFVEALKQRKSSLITA